MDADGTMVVVDRSTPPTGRSERGAQVYPMRRRMNRVMVFLVVVAVIGVGVHIAFQFVTEQNRAAIVGRVQKPESVKLYERLVEKDFGDQVAQQAESTEPAERDLEQDTKDAAETMARYERLFARKRERSFREVWDRLLTNVFDKHPSEWSAEERAQAEGATPIEVA